MAAVVTLMGALALLQVPVVLDRFERHLPARWMVRLGVSSLITGSVLSHLGLLLIALPTLLRAMNLRQFAGVCDRLLLHMGLAVPPFIGWVSSGLLLWSSLMWVRGSVKAVRADRSLREGVDRLTATEWRDYPVYILESPVATAFGLGGRVESIIVTTGLMDRLDPVEREVVLAHEAAHVRFRDPALLRSLRAMELAAPRWLMLGASVGCVRLAVERAADEVASGRVPERRSAAISALLKATGVESPPTPAMSSVETIARRIRALTGPATPQRRFPVATAAIFVTALLVVAVGGVLSWFSHGHAALALAGWCPI